MQYTRPVMDSSSQFARFNDRGAQDVKGLRPMPPVLGPFGGSNRDNGSGVWHYVYRISDLRRPKTIRAESHG